MATSFLGLKLDSSTVAPGLAAFLGIFQVVQGAHTLMVPTTYATNFGIANASASNPFIKVVGGRAISSGLGLLALAYFRYNRAIGALLATGIVTGWIDGITVLNHADSPEQKAIFDSESQQKARNLAAGHVGVTTFLSALGIWILSTA